MRKVEKDKIIKYSKLAFIILIITLVAFSKIFEDEKLSNKLSQKDLWLLVIYLFGIVFIPTIAYCVIKLKKQKY